MSSASEKAMEAATAALDGEYAPEALARQAVTAAHDPALGLDRSVCLREVVEAVGHAAFHPTGEVAGFRRQIIDFIESKFGSQG